MSATDDPSAAITRKPRDQLDHPAIALDASGVLNKATLLRGLSAAFNFPDYFGENWDAAYDLLLDQVDLLAAPACWRFSIERDSLVDEADLADWLQLMADLCGYAESRAQALRVELYADGLSESACPTPIPGF